MESVVNMVNPSSPIEILEAKIRELNVRFLNSLDERILKLENAAAELRANPGAQEPFRLIGADCHKLAGTSESFGFSKIGELANEINDQIHNRNAQWPEIEVTLEELLTAMEEELV